LFSMLSLEARWALHRVLHRCRGLSALASDIFIDRMPRQREAAQNVIVLGAGLAGLSAAYRLLKLGHQVTVLEGSGRAGGRALTLREPFTAGLHADAGGFRFRDDHHLVKSYVKRFNLAVAPFYPVHGNFLGYIGGTLYSRRRWERIQSKTLPRKLTEREEWCCRQEYESQTYKLREGANALPNAFAQQLGSRIRFNCAVRSIEHHTQYVRVGFMSAGEAGELVADRLICALPFSALRRISISPQVSPGKQRMITELPYESPCLVFLQVRTSFLEKQGLNGFTFTDTVGEVWNLTFDREGPVGILVSYTRGQLGQYFAAMEESDRVRTTIERMETIFPGISSHVERATSKCWGQDEWTVGAQSVTHELPHSDILIIRRPEGRVHFAGEHTARRHRGWMEGAIESGHRAAREIDQGPTL
jgi:monoamine oxidase